MFKSPGGSSHFRPGFAPIGKVKLLNHKAQIINIKQISMTKIQNVSVSNIEYLNLRFICNLMLGFWDFIIFS